MRNALLIGVVGIVLFAGSAASSWYLIQCNTHNNDCQDSAEDASTAGQSSNTHGTDSSRSELDKSPAATAKNQNLQAMPVALLPDQPMTVEAILQLGQAINSKEKQLNERENIILKDEERIKMMFEDLKREQQELTAFAESIDLKVVEAREAMEKLKQQQQTLDEQHKALATLQKSTGQTVENAENAKMLMRVSSVKDWFKALEAEPSASYLREFANRGDLEFAARLLDSQEDRTKAEILSALNDAQLGMELMNALSGVNQTSQTSQTGQGN